MTDQSETMSKAEKKSEVLEVRLPHETKKAFMEACKDKNKTASGVLRTAIDGFLASGVVGPVRSRLRDTVFVVIGTAIGAFAYAWAHAFLAVPEVADNPLAQLYFAQVDTNGDLRVSREEFVAAITARGTLSRDEIGSDETVLRTTGVALIIPQAQSVQLKNTGRLDGCFKTLAETGNTEQSREFYSLDKNQDNQLSVTEFSESARIPAQADLEDAFRAKDLNNDRLLDRGEAAENIEDWTAANATPNNTHTSSKYLDVPESCKTPETEVREGRLYIKFEQLKRRIDTLSAEALPLVDGLTDERFANLDGNKDSRLSFAEFIRWYL